MVTASATGSGGGFVDVRSANSSASSSPTVTTTVGTGAVLRGGDVDIRSVSQSNASAVSAGGGGGLVSIGSADATAAVGNAVATTVGTGADIAAAGDLGIYATSTQSAVSRSNTDGVGLGSGVHANSNVFVDHTSTLTINGALAAAGTLTAESNDTVRVDNRASGYAGGLGADANSDAHTYLGNTAAADATRLGAAGRLTGRVVNVNAVTGRHDVNTTANTDADALGANCDATATVVSRGGNLVQLDGGSYIEASKVYLTAAQNNMTQRAYSNSSLDALGGDTDSTADLNYVGSSRVFGRDESVIRTPYLIVTTDQRLNLSRGADRDGAFIDTGDTHGGLAQTGRRDTFWESTVIMSGAVDPVVEVDASGMLTRADGNVVVRERAPGSTTLSAPLTPGVSKVQAGYDIVVDDIGLTGAGGYALFQANDLAPDSTIVGNAGTFVYQQTFNGVRIANSSDRNLVVNDIDVVNRSGEPLIQAKIDVIPDATATPGQSQEAAYLPFLTLGLPANYPNATFHFDIVNKVTATDVQVLNLQPGGSPRPR